MATMIKPAEKQVHSSIPSLNGWRAFCIIMVLGSHSTRTHGFPIELKSSFHWLFDGGLGVRWFFVISGYLITWLLVKERERSGKLNFGGFYARRGLRLMPVYFAYLAVLVVLQCLTPFSHSVGEWVGNIFFLTNFVGSTWPSAHLWSLAVEQQFYLVWPVLLAKLTQQPGSLRTSLLVLGVPLLVAPVFRVVSYTQCYQSPFSFLFLNHSFFNYFDSLAVGCMAALTFARNPQQVVAFIAKYRNVISISAVLLVAIPYVLSKLFLLGIITVPLGPTMQAIGFVLLMLLSIIHAKEFVCWRLLNHWLVAEIGVLSYSLYIWQQLFCADPKIFGFPNAWWNGFPFWLGPTILVSMLSYYGLEKPLLAIRAKLRKS